MARGIGRPFPSVGIEVRNLFFRYAANDPWVLEDVSFRVEPGEWVAIAGPSGCGKTTLLKLLTGLLEPTAGVVFVNGEPLSRIPAEEWRATIGVVMQDDSLYAGSIEDNISFFAAGPDQDRIETSARLAAVHEDIVAMPMGYGTLIGDMGTVLSGGQKQRVLLARALYRQPCLLLLDEATSHLDVIREQAVNDAMEEMSVTRIVVAHRPETIHAAKRVLGLAKGKIVSDSVQRDGPEHEDKAEDHSAPNDRRHYAA
jgi:ATP-binding cassette subfamily B protein RaxB